MKVIFLSGDELWFRCLPAARAAKRAGAEVIVMAPFRRFRPDAEAEGYRVINWHISRRSLNPLRELASFLEVLRVYRRERPELVHHLALKAILYGGTATRFCRGVAAVSTVTGLGRVFTISSRGMMLLRRVLCSFLRTIFERANCRITFENEDDLELFVSQKIVAREVARTIPGVGLDTERFSPVPERQGVPIVMLPSRMLWAKGVALFVDAAAQLRKDGIRARFVLVGASDLESRGYIPERQLRAWVETGHVEWWGSNGDMPGTLSQAHVVCLPTYYREGIPRVLMEASACARAIVTTDTPGCRHVVRHGENGLLVPIKDVASLATAIKRLIQDEQLRKQMGAAGRARAVREFAENRVQTQIFEVYRSLLQGNWPPAADVSSSELEEPVGARHMSADANCLSK